MFYICINQKIVYVLKEPILRHIHKTIIGPSQLKQCFPDLYVCGTSYNKKLPEVIYLSFTNNISDYTFQQNLHVITRPLHTCIMEMEVCNEE
jgi:hypothetical protein